MRRCIRAYILSLLRPRTFAELMDTQAALFPGGEVGDDLSGQLVLYTGQEEMQDGRLFEVENNDS